MINGNYDNHPYNDGKTRRVIMGAMWVVSAAITGGLIYWIYALR